MASIIAHAPAKINLYLGVEPTLKDGKHLLTSVFCTVSLTDTIVFDFISSADPFTVQLEVEALPPLSTASLLDSKTGAVNPNNTMLRTLEVFKQSHKAALLPNGTLHVKLIKSIPTQAGLGGGSSDAAAMLRMLCWLAQIDPLSPQNLKIARAVGADVPFFLHAARTGSCALMDGFGDNLLEQLPVPPLDIVLLKPTQGISTAAAYQAFDTEPQPYTDEQLLIQALRTLAEKDVTSPSLATLTAACTNNLEPAAIKLLPQLAVLKADLQAHPGVLKAMVSGSGSTVCAFCESQEAARRTVKSFSAKDLWVVVAQTARPT
jgi:4-diphosphocytidyl-2-C-methyl-D-erythritol kinase